MYRSKLLASSGLVTGRGEHVSSRKALLVAVAQVGAYSPAADSATPAVPGHRTAAAAMLAHLPLTSYAVVQRDHATAEALLRTRPGCLKVLSLHPPPWQHTPAGMVAGSLDSALAGRRQYMIDTCFNMPQGQKRHKLTPLGLAAATGGGCLRGL